MDTPEKNSKRPNIVVILTDDQRYDTINALGNREIYTPNMDYLVENGTSFVNAHIMGGSHPAICMPSRAMINTGRSAFSLERCGYAIPPEHITLGEALSKNGYESIGIGKWHNGISSYVRSFTDGDEILFAGMEDHWNVPLCHFSKDGSYPPSRPFRTRLHMGRDKEVVERSYDHIYEGSHSSEIFADAAVSMIRKYAGGDKPMFMYLATMAPHDPRTMPKKYLDMYDPEKISLPENYLPEHPFDKGDMKLRDEYLAPFPRTPQSVKSELRDYYAMITHLDAQIGRVLDALRQTGELDNTLIFFAGDNGLAIGSHGLMGKQNLYEHSIRVPFIMCGPGVPAGVRCQGNVLLNSIFATACDFAGISAPDSVQFPSLSPYLRGESDASGDEAMFFLYTNYARAVKRHPYKLIEYLVDNKRMTQLFDLEIDPWEMNNLYLSPEFSSTVRELRSILLDRQKSFDDPMTGMFGDYDLPVPTAGRVRPCEKTPTLICHGIFDYSLDDADMPEPMSGGYVAKVECASVTAADIMAYKGSPRFWGNGDPAAFAIPPYIPLGEFTIRLDDAFGGLTAGDRAIVESVVPCGECHSCRIGKPQSCMEQHTLGFMTGFSGGASRYVSLPKNARLVKIPDGLDSETALLTWDVAQAVLCADRAAITGADIVVLAAQGPLGLAAVQQIATRKPKLFIVLAQDEELRKAAKELGADIVINPATTTVLRDKRMMLLNGEFDILRLTGGRGCDVFINTVQESRNVMLGLELLAIGGRYLECAVFEGWIEADWSLIADRKSLCITGIPRGRGDFERAVNFLSLDKKLTSVITQSSFSLSQWKIAFESMFSAVEKRAISHV